MHSHCAFSANILRIWIFVPFLLNLIAFRSAKTEKDFWGFLTVLSFLFGLSGCILMGQKGVF